MTWDEVEARSDVIGGYFEFKEDGNEYIGPVSQVVCQRGRVLIHMTWTAYRPEGTLLFGSKLPIPSVVVFREDEVTPFAVNDTKISAVIPWLGMTTLHLKGSVEAGSNIAGLIS